MTWVVSELSAFLFCYLNNFCDVFAQRSTMSPIVITESLFVMEIFWRKKDMLRQLTVVTQNLA